MTSIIEILPALFPTAIWLTAAVLCLLLEAAGTPVGARKIGARTHLPWVIAIAGVIVVARNVNVWPLVEPRVIAGLAFDRSALLSSALVAVLVVAAHVAAVPGLRALDEERGEMSGAFALAGAGLSTVAIAVDPVLLAASLLLSLCALPLLAAPDREGPHGIEAATKGVVLGGVALVFLGGAQLFVELDSPLAPHTVVLWSAALVLLIGAVPVHQGFVDVAHGSSAGSAALWAAGTVVAGGSALLRLVDAIADAGGAVAVGDAWTVLALLTLVGAPVAALDQSRIARVVALLAATPAGIVLAACASSVTSPVVADAAWRSGTAALVAGALGACAMLLGAAVPRLPPSSTWEDWAGFGRKRPVVAALMVYGTGVVVGVPGTIGFDARLDVARAAFDAGLDVLGLAVVATAALGAAPLVRLALFLYAKEPPPRRERPPAPAEVLLVAVFAVLVMTSAALAARPMWLDALLAAAR